MSVGAWIAFLVVASAGACARYFLDGWVQAQTKSNFPWGTCVVNVSGSFVLGVIAGLALYHGLSVDTRLVLGAGLCGSYTTFSAFACETVRLGGRGAAVRNVVANTVGALIAAAAGLGLAAL
jgi:CrcB protein